MKFRLYPEATHFPCVVVWDQQSRKSGVFFLKWWRSNNPCGRINLGYSGGEESTWLKPWWKRVLLLVTQWNKRFHNSIQAQATLSFLIFILYFLQWANHKLVHSENSSSISPDFELKHYLKSRISLILLQHVQLYLQTFDLFGKLNKSKVY